MMPTIDQLDVASAIADSDELLISQNGASLRATRAQIVAGLQTQLAVPQASVLGRCSPGTGAPETVAVGSGLSLQSGVLSVLPTAPAFATLPKGNQPAGGDLVPLGQSGRDVALPYAQFMAGLSGLAVSMVPTWWQDRAAPAFRECWPTN